MKARVLPGHQTTTGYLNSLVGAGEAKGVILVSLDLFPHLQIRRVGLDLVSDQRAQKFL
jgi:hypothetical protein